MRGHRAEGQDYHGGTRSSGVTSDPDAAGKYHGDRGASGDVLGDRLGRLNLELPMAKEWRGHQWRDRSELFHAADNGCDGDLCRIERLGR